MGSNLLRFLLWHWKWAVVTIVVVVAVLGASYWLATRPSLPPWTNFNDKGLWDVLDLVLVPLALAVVAFLFSNRERENDRRIAKDREEEQALQTYFDRMTELMLERNLGGSEDIKTQTIARARTLTTLRRLSPERKASLILFLYEAKLISKNLPNIRLVSADLSQANLEGANLEGANLEGANLEGAWLQGANLKEANLQEAHLNGAHINRANLQGVNFQGAHLWGTELTEANLEGANLQEAHLVGTHLLGATYNKSTIWPDGIRPDEGTVPQDTTL